MRLLALTPAILVLGAGCLMAIDYDKVDSLPDAGSDAGFCAPLGDAPAAASCNGQGPGADQSCGVDATDDCCSMVAVPCGSFFRGFDASGRGTQDYPAALSDFWLDRYEVTVGRFRAFVASGGGTQAWAPAPGAGSASVDAGSGWHAEWNAQLAHSSSELAAALRCEPDGPSWTDAPGPEERKPINCVTWFEALAFCIWDGGRLPTEAEHAFAAAGGAEQRVYPWSTPASSDAIDADYAAYGCEPSPSACSATSRLSMVGTHVLGDARWGHADLAGNVAEWTLDWQDWDAGDASYLVPCTDCVDVGDATARAIRGGSFRSLPGDPSELRVSVPGSTSPTARSASLGFRCARALVP
jgi:formylglycine-generating enzyme